MSAQEAPTVLGWAVRAFNGANVPDPDRSGFSYPIVFFDHESMARDFAKECEEEYDDIGKCDVVPMVDARKVAAPSMDEDESRVAAEGMDER